MVPPAREQVFEHMSLWGTLPIQSRKLVEIEEDVRPRGQDTAWPVVGPGELLTSVEPKETGCSGLIPDTGLKREMIENNPRT